MDQYIGFDCPNCTTYCIYSNGDVSDLTIDDVEYVQCWHCQRVSRTPEYEGEDFQLLSREDSVGKCIQSSFK